MINEGVVPALLNILTFDPDPCVQYEAAAAFLNISNGKSNRVVDEFIKHVSLLSVFFVPACYLSHLITRASSKLWCTNYTLASMLRLKKSACGFLVALPVHEKQASFIFCAEMCFQFY